MLAGYEGARLPQQIIEKWTNIVNDAAKRNDRKTHEVYSHWLSLIGYT